MKNKLQFTTTLIIGLCFLLSGCYKEERFSMPGTGNYEEPARDSMPYPFDGSNLVYLIKDGVPDFTKMSVMSFTDFAVEMPANEENSSWFTGKDEYGKTYYACRQHKNFYAIDNSEHFGGNQLSYEYNALISRIFLENGNGKNWKLSALMSFDVLNRNTQSIFSFEGSLGWSKRFLMLCDWNAHFCISRNSTLINNIEGGNAVSGYRFCAPGEPVNIEICCVNKLYYIKLNGETMWTSSQEEVKEHAFPFIFRPWMSGVRFYELSIEGDYLQHTPVGVQQENNYAAIQAPALATSGNSVLLFAEGRQENIMQSSKLTSVRSNATDIIVKRSTDAGDNWDSWTILKGGNNGVYLRPAVINAGDKLYLFYTVDKTGRQEGNYQIEYLVSEDGGNNWQAGNTINASLEGYTVSTLSGHGIKTSDGRLVLPVQCRTGKKGSIATLSSTDNGASWELGNPVDGLRNLYANIVEINNELVLYISHSSSDNSRTMSKSTDGGINWTTPVLTHIPVGNNGYRSYSATVSSEDGKIYHFTPTGIDNTSSFNGSSVNTDPAVGPGEQKRFYLYKPGYDIQGKGLSLTISSDGGNEWTTAKDLTGFTSYTEYGLPTGAMDAVITGNYILLVVESGSTVPYEGLLMFKETR